MTRPDPAVAASSRALFGKEWLRAPLRVGAVVPSSPALALAISDGISAADGPVIELGPGTGVFTRALLARGIPPQNIAAIEAGAAFAERLSLQHPDIHVIHGDAARIRLLSPFGETGVGTVVCGLPLLSIPTAKVLRILAGCRAVLRPGGTIRLFTYGIGCPVPSDVLGRAGLVARRIAFVPKNVPPASVYVLQAKGASG